MPRIPHGAINEGLGFTGGPPSESICDIRVGSACFCVGDHFICDLLMPAECSGEVYCWISKSGKEVCGCYIFDEQAGYLRSIG